MQHITFYLMRLMKTKMFIFRNNKKLSQSRTGRTVELNILQWVEISGTHLLTIFLEFDPSLFLQTQLIPKNVLFSMKLWACWLQGNCTFYLTLNKKFLSRFNFVPTINEVLSKTPSISGTFVKERYWTFNIAQSFCVRRKCFLEVS